MYGSALAATRMVWLLFANLGDEKSDLLQSQRTAFDAATRTLVDSGTAILIASRSHSRDLAFADSASLLRGALSVYRATKRASNSSQPHGLRTAVHAGIAHDRHGILEGPSLTRAHRLRALANPGQILFSGSAHDLTSGALPAGIQLRSLGSHRLKEIASPERVYQLIAPDLADEFAPLQSPSSIPNNLVLPTSRFIGRTAEIRNILALLSREHLITLAGPGGVGKTRLATIIASQALQNFPDGVWMIELAPLNDVSSIASTLAFHFGVRNVGDRPLIDAVVDTLYSKHALIVFDNCEHLIREIAPIIAIITQTAPHIRILTTSRTPLDLLEERVERVDSLAVPTKETRGIDMLLKYDSIALFIDRVRAVRPQIEITPDVAATIGRICHRLDGVPLAIELAAARTSAFELDEIETMLAQRFELLVSEDATKTPRQQTLRGLIDWSFALLSPAQRHAFICLSIFVGTFSLQDAQVICSDENDDFITVLASLVDRSLVVGELDDGAAQVRYHLLESTREYGLDRLVESGERMVMERRHARHFMRVAGEHDRQRSLTAIQAWLERIDRDYDNIASATQRALERDEIETAASITGRLREYWPQRRPDEGRRLVEASLADTSRLDVATLADLWLADSLLSNRVRNDRRTLESSLLATNLFESSKLRTRGYVTALRMRSFARTMLGEVERAEIDAKEAITVAHEIGDLREANRAITQLAQARMARGAYIDASDLLRRAVEESTHLGERVDVILQDLAEAEFWSGNVPRAIEAVQRAIDTTLEEDPSAMPIGSYVNLAAYFISLRRYDDARKPAREALRMALIIGHRYIIAIATLHLGAIALGLNDLQRGTWLIGFSDAIHNSIGLVREHTEEMEREHVGALLGATFSHDELAVLLAAGASMSDVTAVEHALAV